MVYAEHAPFDEGHLKVSELHSLHYMQTGNPQGKPVVFLHGGPGGSAGVTDTIYFDPAVFRVVLFSQRGCGKSTPAGETKENTTWDLVADIERLREHVGIDKWIVFGGSWGSTLALAYSQTHPDRVQALALRGIFLFRRKEIEFFWLTGTRWFWPAEWEEFAAPIKPEDRRDFETFSQAYYALLTHPDDKISLDAAQRWSRWESQVARLLPEHEAIAKSDTDIRWARCVGDVLGLESVLSVDYRTFALMECHYSLNHGFMPDGHLITEEQIAKIRHIPCAVAQGRYDLVCPVLSAHDLAQAWGKGLRLHIVDDAGHSAKEPGTSKILSQAGLG
ncbi:prolyl aminopeptidase serine peptidase [Papiliotrema laurentii]|uniref:Proline iminopeptidase n=1 Tax=Papiliotrema laurentii TaxID=5418 RepID=A0AAD9FNF8_PAPLA|nr:prolyl aminopeptidase serine peptidase [Papiliotrema laurentii]